MSFDSLLRAVVQLALGALGLTLLAAVITVAKRARLARQLARAALGLGGASALLLLAAAGVAYLDISDAAAAERSHAIARSASELKKAGALLLPALFMAGATQRYAAARAGRES